jgi:hypothetical protein
MVSKAFVKIISWIYRQEKVAFGASMCGFGLLLYCTITAAKELQEIGALLISIGTAVSPAIVV